VTVTYPLNGPYRYLTDRRAGDRRRIRPGRPERACHLWSWWDHG